MDTPEEYLRDRFPTELDKEIEAAEHVDCDYCGTTMVDHKEAYRNTCYKDLDSGTNFCIACTDRHLEQFNQGDKINIVVYFQN